MTSVLLDTSILIHAQRNRAFALGLDDFSDALVISRIAACELIYGSRDKKEKNVNRLVTQLFKVIEVNEAISKRAFLLIDQYGLKTRLGISDALIAATAIEEDLVLWTLNTKHFEMIEEVELFTSKAS